jgi:hypothetical protein
MEKRAKAPKPVKVNRKLTLSKETVARLTDALQRPKCTFLRTGCLAYTC